jgi:hypothetical protein
MFAAPECVRLGNEAGVIIVAESKKGGEKRK